MPFDFAPHQRPPADEAVLRLFHAVTRGARTAPRGSGLTLGCRAALLLSDRITSPLAKRRADYVEDALHHAKFALQSDTTEREKLAAIVQIEIAIRAMRKHGGVA